MRLQSMHVGMKVRHPDYGVGTVKSVSEHLADIRFDSGLRTLAPDQCDLQSADAQADLSGLTVPLPTLITETVAALVKELGLERDDSIVGQLAGRWQNGTLVLRPPDASLQSKEVPLEVFFHKIVMVRNNLRVLEQKINAHEKLSDAEKVEMQQYITRCYGSMTTFNILFKEKEDQFSSKGE
ncbi:MAG TPA: hypothetical protein VMQ67_08560 [Candidatus Saccharimonadales bacterium]|nr:hypothetical protein [Candidatus Saccharimonadales bacterium]